MSISTFKLYDDNLLTILSLGTWQNNCKTDFSEGSLDIEYWFGSIITGRILYSKVNPSIDNIYLTPTYILPEFEISHVYSLGDSIVPTVLNGYRYVCTTAGTSAGTEPTWGIILNGTTTSGTAVFTLVAEDSPITEIKLATSLVGLDSATGGAALSLGTSLSSGVGNAFNIHVRLTNTISEVSSSIGTPEYAIQINATEYPI